MDELLREQYETTLAMAEEIRQKCYGADGRLVAVVKDSHGRAVPNPWLTEYHRLIREARDLARDLGITRDEGPAEAGSLVKATRSGTVKDRLRELSLVIAEEIEHTTGHGKAALCRVYLDATREIQAIGGEEPERDEIEEVISRKANPDLRRFSVVQ